MTAVLWFMFGFFACLVAMAIVSVVVIRMITTAETTGQHAETRDKEGTT
jgi:hypothetical protein